MGQSAALQNHPFWSVDREEFVEAGHLSPGERVLLATGDTRRVIQTVPPPGPRDSLQPGSPRPTRLPRCLNRRVGA